MSDRTVCFVTCLRAELILELSAAKSSASKSVLLKKIKRKDKKKAKL